MASWVRSGDSGTQQPLFLDLPIHGKQVALRVLRQRYRCTACVWTRVYHVLPAEVGQLEVTQLLDQAGAELGHERAREEAWVL